MPCTQAASHLNLTAKTASRKLWSIGEYDLLEPRRRRGWVEASQNQSGKRDTPRDKNEICTPEQGGADAGHQRLAKRGAGGEGGVRSVSSCARAYDMKGLRWNELEIEIRRNWP